MADVVVNPFKKLSTVLPAKHAAATAGAPGAIVMKAPIVAILAPRRDVLIRCRPGSTKGFDDIRPASLRAATTEPVKVIPPIEKSEEVSLRFENEMNGCSWPYQ